MGDDVAGDEALLADGLGGEVAGKAVEVHAQAAGVGTLVATGEEGGDDAREDIAAASRRHTAVARGTELHMTVGETEGGVMALENDVALEMARKFAGTVEPLIAVGAGSARQTVQFLGVGREDEVARQLLHPGTVTGEDVDGIGIDDEGMARAAQLGDEGDGGGLVDAESRTYAYGIILVSLHRLAEDRLVGIHLQNSLGH